jgi:hypothetical protein
VSNLQCIHCIVIITEFNETLRLAAGFKRKQEEEDNLSAASFSEVISVCANSAHRVATN